MNFDQIWASIEGSVPQEDLQCGAEKTHPKKLWVSKGFLLFSSSRRPALNLSPRIAPQGGLYANLMRDTRVVTAQVPAMLITLSAEITAQKHGEPLFLLHAPRRR
jgi:hypothetical protein